MHLIRNKIKLWNCLSEEISIVVQSLQWRLKIIIAMDILYNDLSECIVDCWAIQFVYKMSLQCNLFVFTVKLLSSHEEMFPSHLYMFITIHL